MSRLILNNRRVALPSPNYKLRQPWININLADIRESKVENQGSLAAIQLSRVPDLMPLPYQVYEYGQPRTDKEVNREHYDGVTCDNHHMTLRLERDKADITFKYDYQDDTVPKREQSSI